MEPLTAAAFALGGLLYSVSEKFGQKALEKMGEKAGEKIFTASEGLLESLKQKPTKLGFMLEQAPQQPIDLGEAVLEVDAIAQEDSDIAETIKVLAAAAQADPNPEVQAWIQKVLEAQQAQQASVTNQGKLADKIGVVAQNSPVNIDTFNMN